MIRDAVSSSNSVAYLGGRYVGHRVAGEVWVASELDSEMAHKIERALKTGRMHYHTGHSGEES